MSVTVADLLKLPSLQKATVVAGKGGLDRVVSSISVLESINPDDLVPEVFNRNDYSGGEIVITGFLNCLNDVDLQCSNMQALIEGGEVGLVLYYVGAYLKKIDDQLIEMADENDFPLIQMPCGKRALRYSDLISDVTECIYLDRVRNNALVSDALARITSTPNNQHAVTMHELLRAVLQDEPLKMRRLAEIFNIDVASLHEIWIIFSDNRDFDEESINLFIEQAKQCANIVIGAIYDGRPLLSLSTPHSVQRIENVMQLIGGEDVTIVRCGNLQNTTDCRAAYLSALQNIDDAKRIFKNKKVFQNSDLEFTAMCRRAISEGEAFANNMTLPISALTPDGDSELLIETLCVYLLDCDCSTTLTSKKLFLHRNTVKYRIKRISDLLGYRINKMPEMIDLYKSAAVYRLLHS